MPGFLRGILFTLSIIGGLTLAYLAASIAIENPTHYGLLIQWAGIIGPVVAGLVAGIFLKR